MKIVVFGLTISCSWSNGHAALWRGLCKALDRLGHQVVFFEHDDPLASERDWHSLPHGKLILYSCWSTIASRAQREIVDADVAIVTSHCPDALRAGDAVVHAQRPISVFYDLDAPATLSHLRQGEPVPYVGDDGLRAYDLVLSNTGGAALEELRCSLGARRVRVLYGHVDPDLFYPTQPAPRYAADLSWLGASATDCQAELHELFVEAARRLPRRRFLIGGARYAGDFAWTENVRFVHHVPPSDHPAFFSSARLTLNTTSNTMADMGWCPSGRLFEAAACGAAVLSDEWCGLDEFYTPAAEILVAHNVHDTLAALSLSTTELARIGRAARERTLDQHTCHHRGRALVDMIAETRSPRTPLRPGGGDPSYARS